MAKPHTPWDNEASAAANARRCLPLLVSSYFAGVRRVLARSPSPGRLHRLRLDSKRLRYTLELFRPCYPAALEERLEALKKLQDLLGETNDAVATSRLLRGPLRRQPELRQFIKRRAGERAAAFLREWTERFDAPGREEWWTGFLARNAHAPRRAAR
jgi:CHAD domain-containing protein